MVRAKFRVNSVTKFEGEYVSVKLSPVTSGSEENKGFWKYTPSGTLEMSITNPEASKQFEPGKEFYVDFSPVE